MSAAAAAGTETASCERILTEPGTTGATVAAAVAVCPNADRGSRSRSNGGPSRGQGRRFAGSLSRHPLRYRKPHPPLSPLPCRPTSGCGCSPSPTTPGEIGRSSPPAASACCSLGTRLRIPTFLLGPQPGERAPRGTGDSLSTRLLSGCGARRDGARVGHLYHLCQLRPQNLLPALRTREHWISSEELCLLSLKEGLGLKERGLRPGMRWGKAERCVLNPIVRKKGFGYLIDVVRIKALYGPLPISLCYVK